MNARDPLDGPGWLPSFDPWDGRLSEAGLTALLVALILAVTLGFGGLAVLVAQLAGWVA